MTKRQGLVFKKLYKLNLKGSRVNNYLRLRSKFLPLIKKKNNFRDWMNRGFYYARLKRYIDLVKLYIHILVCKKNKGLLNSNLKFIGLNIFKIFLRLQIVSFFLKQFDIYLYRLHKYELIFNRIQIYKTYVYIKSK
jgi:hypothetical protein